MKLDYKKYIPKRFHNASYEKDVPQQVKELVKTQFKKQEGLYIWGESGVGKTHIVCALAKYILEKGVEVMFLNTSDFLAKLREGFDKPLDEESGLFRDVMNFKGVIIFDDIGAEKSSDWVNERLYLIINKKYEDMNQVIFTSNYSLEDLAGRIQERSASRIKGMVDFLELDGEDKR